MMKLATVNIVEWVRLKFFNAVLFLALIFIFISFLLGSLSYIEQQRLIFDFGLAAIEMTTVIISIFLATHALFKDIERKTIQIVLSRPIPRWQYIISYFFSLAMLNAVVIFILGTVLFFFLSNDKYYLHFLVSITVIYFKSLVISAFGLLCGVIARPVFGVVISFFYWAMSYSMLDLIFFSEKSKNQTLIIMSKTLNFVVPHFYKINWKNYSFLRSEIISSQIFWAYLHCLSWVFILMLVTILFFRRKEIV